MQLAYFQKKTQTKTADNFCIVSGFYRKPVCALGLK